MNYRVAPCPDCDGIGFHHTPTAFAGDTPVIFQMATCPSCHGTGIARIPKTRGDQIRDMKDEELADLLLNLNFCGIFCTNKKECRELVAADKDIPDEWCKKCFVLYLQEPADDLRPRPNIFEDKQESGLIEED